MTWIGPSFKAKVSVLTTTTNLKQWKQQLQYITYYWPNFDRTQKLGFCDQYKQQKQQKKQSIPQQQLSLVVTQLKLIFLLKIIDLNILI